MPRKLTVSLLALALAGALGLGIWAVQWPGAPPEAVQPASESAGFVLRAHPAPVELPEIAFEDGAGRRRSLAHFRGRHVLVNIWATWCAPCREEMPSLARLQKQLGGPRFEVLPLSIDAAGAQAVRSFYRELGVEGLGIYVDANMRVTSALRVQGVPTTLLLDREGREIARHVGPAEWDAEPAVQSILRLVARAEE